jgi:hypothetical protein
LICQGDGDGQDCSPTLRQLVFRGNAAGIGGGMACLGLNQGACSATLEGVTFAGNTAQFGGGMASAGMAGGHCTPVLHNITFSGNSTSFGGGAFANVTATDGGSSSAVLRNVTLSGNLGAEGADGGGAIFNWKSNDTAGTATAQLVNAVAWDNGPNAIGGDPMTFQHSILQNGCPAGSICTDLVAGDPKLGALQDTGGATPVRLPGMDSAALDAGGCVDAPATDQRGVVRPQGAACDVGAAEVRQARLTVAASGAGKVGTIAAPASIGAAITDCRQGSGDCSAWYRAEPDAPVIALILYPDAGNAVQSVSGCGGSLAGNVFTTAGLGADCTVEVAFAPIARSIGGTVTGLAGNGLVLLLNGSSALPISANGTFAFGTTITAGNPYAVTIGTQPSQPSQTCVMVNGSGTVGDGDVTNVVVHCGAAATYSVGGTLAGLATGASITLAINSGNELTLAANGAYAFAPRFAPGDGFVVAVAAQPAGQHCTLSRVAGTVGSGNVADVDVTCSAGGAHLQLGVTDAGDYARYGQVRDYFVTLANTGNDSAIGVAIGAELDPPSMRRTCSGPASAEPRARLARRRARAVLRTARAWRREPSSCGSCGCRSAATALPRAPPSPRMPSVRRMRATPTRWSCSAMGWTCPTPMARASSIRHAVMPHSKAPSRKRSCRPRARRLRRSPGWAIDVPGRRRQCRRRPSRGADEKSRSSRKPFARVAGPAARLARVRDGRRRRRSGSSVPVSGFPSRRGFPRSVALGSSCAVQAPGVRGSVGCGKSA